MHVITNAGIPGEADAAAHDDDVPGRVPRNRALGELATVIYLDRRAFTRDCVGNWLQSSPRGFTVRVLSDLDELEVTKENRKAARANRYHRGRTALNLAEFLLDQGHAAHGLSDEPRPSSMNG
jgi:hypothetical protein